MSNIADIQEEIVEEFALFDNWMDKYEHIIAFGKELPAIGEEHQTEENLVKGCQSRVWLVPIWDGEALSFAADSDAIITKGLVGLLLRVLSGQPPAAIAEADLFFIEQVGLNEHLSPTRSNGLVAMVKKMKMMALAYAAKKHQRMSETLDKKALENIIVDVIKTIYDPEIPVDIYELGLIYNIAVDDEANVVVDMTLTSPSCPVAESLPAEVEEKIKGIAQVKAVKLNLTFDPPWERDMMSEEAQLELGLL